MPSARRISPSRPLWKSANPASDSPFSAFSYSTAFYHTPEDYARLFSGKSKGPGTGALPLATAGGRALRLFGYALTFEKLCNAHTLWMFHIQAKEIFIAGEDDIHIPHNGCVQDRLVFCVPYQFFRMVYPRN